MFLAGDRLEHRETRIKDFLNSEPAIAVLLAAASLEWSISRAIVRFGRTPNSRLREMLVGCYGLDTYKKLWQDEVISSSYPMRLAQVVRNWEAVKTAFGMRGGLIHGKSTCTRNTAEPHVEILLEAARDVAAYFENRGVGINDRIPVRRKERRDAIRR